MTQEWKRNLLACYSRAIDSDVVAGKLWYRLARETAFNLAKQHKLLDAQGEPNYTLVCGLIAALSPQMGWKHNVALVADCLKRKRFHGHTGANVTKAKRIYKGESPLSVLGGLKVRAFFECMVNPETLSVCIDRHAYSILLGHAVDDKERNRAFKAKPNREAQRVYRETAFELGLNPSELQAITWVTWRREKGISD